MSDFLTRRNGTWHFVRRAPPNSRPSIGVGSSATQQKCEWRKTARGAGRHVSRRSSMNNLRASRVFLD